MAKQPMGDVVVVLPGILGSVLEKDGKEVWAMTPGAAFRALISLGGSIKDLRLDGDDHTADNLGDGVSASRLLPDLHLVPGLWKIDGYGAITKAIRDRFDVVPGENFFEFPYDWRRDNRVHGRRLARQAHTWLSNWRQKSGNDDAKLILLAHSMGGLVSRAFLELNDGWRDTRALITFGTPYRGSLDALSFLHRGMKKGIGPVGLDLTEFLRSLTSVYQLLPIYPAVESAGGTLRVSETDISGVDRDRAAGALAFHREIESGVSAREPNAYAIHPVVGIGQPTLQGALFDGDRLRMLRSLRGRDMGGDGTVPRVSAMPIEMDDASSGLFSPAVHSSLQNTDAVITQVEGILTGADIDLSGFRDRYKGVSIDLPDMFDAAAGLRIQAAPTGGRASSLTASVVNVDTGEAAWSGQLAEDVDWYSADTPPLEPGIFRVTVASESAQVSDLVMATGAE